MTDMLKIPKLARRNVIFLAGCTGALALFAALALLPNTYKLNRQNKEIRQLQAQVNEQVTLNQMYLQLEAKLALINKLDAQGLARSEPITVRETSRIITMLEGLAKEKGVAVEEVKPVVESGSMPLHKIRVQAILHGNLDQHRAFLVDLLRESNVDDIEQITLSANGRDITLRIIMALKVA